MRGARSAKFAEYASTYAILNNIGLHKTTLIERRDASVGFGVYVRDACDTGTTLLVVPAHRIASVSVVSRIGTRVSLNMAPADSRVVLLNAGLITFLTGAADARAWAELSWRLALEQHRSYSHWWGWLQSVPSSADFAELTAAALTKCRVLYPSLHPFFLKAHRRIEEEKRMAHALIAERNLSPTLKSFSWAVDALLTRGLTVPKCCLDASASDSDSSRDGATELGIVPYVDLINAPDSVGRAPNAAIEVSAIADDLPEWYLQWVLHEAKLSGRDGAADLGRVLSQRFCVCLSLTKPLRAAEEVIVPYNLSPITTGVLSAREDELLTRLLKYGYE